MGQGAINISQGWGHIGHCGIFWKAEILRKLHEQRFRYGIGTYKKTYVEAGPGHSDQHLVMLYLKSRASRETFEGKNKISVFVVWALNWWLVILKETSEKQTVWRIWHRDVWKTERKICLARKDEQEIIWVISRWYLKEEEGKQWQRRLQWKQRSCRRFQDSAVKIAAWKWAQNLLTCLLFCLLLSWNSLLCTSKRLSCWLGHSVGFNPLCTLAALTQHPGHANSQGWGVGLENKGGGKKQTLSSLIKLLLSAINNNYK